MSKRTAVITGGASGIGRAAALKFASKGDQVIVADFNEAGGSETVELIRDGGGEAAHRPCPSKCACHRYAIASSSSCSSSSCASRPLRVWSGVP